MVSGMIDIVNVPSRGKTISTACERLWREIIMRFCLKRLVFIQSEYYSVKKGH